MGEVQSKKDKSRFSIIALIVWPYVSCQILSFNLFLNSMRIRPIGPVNLAEQMQSDCEFLS